MTEAEWLACDDPGRMLGFVHGLATGRKLRLLPVACWRWADKEVADRVGAGGSTRLTDAVLAGSQEDARLISNFMADNRRQTTDDLLEQIRDILAARLRMGEAGVADFGGGGDF
jgi:hypothetical protein